MDDDDNNAGFTSSTVRGEGPLDDRPITVHFGQVGGDVACEEECVRKSV